ncbi:MAG: nucleotidyltransferase domain-containing protein [Deltaproteobacteria bacterium]|nr:nucleotidyltransferase domain-containing protein [Deltaproteobacteria bacterium]
MGRFRLMLSFNELKEQIVSVCKGQKEIIAVWLFGSRAREDSQSDSDIDIALLLEDNQIGSFPYLDFKVSLERALNRNVDLIILNRAGEILKQQVRKYGKIMYESNHKKKKQWEILSRKFYQDFLHLHDIYMRKLYKHYRSGNG